MLFRGIELTQFDVAFSHVSKAMRYYRTAFNAASNSLLDSKVFSCPGIFLLVEIDTSDLSMRGRKEVLIVLCHCNIEDTLVECKRRIVIARIVNEVRKRI